MAGKACEAGTAGYRCAIREEAQGSGDGTKDVRFSPLLILLPYIKQRNRTPFVSIATSLR